MNHANPEISKRAQAQLIKNSNWYLLLGISLVILGTFALIYSFITTLFSIIYLGFFLIIAGIFHLVKSFKMRHWSSFFLNMLLGILYISAGIFIVYKPELNAITLTLLIAMFLIGNGILKIIFALSKKIHHKGWVIFNGILNVLLGVLIWYQWPYSGLWVIGMFVAIDTIFTGWTWIMIALTAKRLKRSSV
jgi:uncharacterized membrane protein HdeD (DUF308 family)